MIVLESVAKSLDPDIKLLKCAFPYFKYVEDVELNPKWFKFVNTLFYHIHALYSSSINTQNNIVWRNDPFLQS